MASQLWRARAPDVGAVCVTCLLTYSMRIEWSLIMVSHVRRSLLKSATAALMMMTYDDDDDVDDDLADRSAVTNATAEAAS